MFRSVENGKKIAQKFRSKEQGITHSHGLMSGKGVTGLATPDIALRLSWVWFVSNGWRRLAGLYSLDISVLKKHSWIFKGQSHLQGFQGWQLRKDSFPFLAKALICVGFEMFNKDKLRPT